MSSDSFQRRVELLRESWAERRKLKGLAGSHEYEPQFRLLLALHGLAEAAIGDIRAVYGPELELGVGPAPEDRATAFSITLAGAYTVTFALTERVRMGAARWSVSVSIGAGGPGGSISAAGPERRNGQWTRNRVEEILLSVLGAYERNVSENGGRLDLSNGLGARGA